MKNIGIRIQKIRGLRGLSRSQMAEKLNISERSYGKIENGEITLKLDKVVEIAKVLNVDYLSLINSDEFNTFNSYNNNNSNILNNSSFYESNHKEIIKTKDNIISNLKQQIKLLEELLNQYRNSK